MRCLLLSAALVSGCVGLNPTGPDYVSDEGVLGTIVKQIDVCQQYRDGKIQTVLDPHCERIGPPPVSPIPPPTSPP